MIDIRTFEFWDIVILRNNNCPAYAVVFLSKMAPQAKPLCLIG